MPLPPVGEIVRLRVNRRGGTEDALSVDGAIHIRGDVEIGNGIEAEIVDIDHGYAVAEPRPNNAREDIKHISYWMEKDDDDEEVTHPRQRREKPRWMKETPKEESPRNAWLKDATEAEEGDGSSNEQGDDVVGSKNDLLNGNL